MFSVSVAQQLVDAVWCENFIQKLRMKQNWMLEAFDCTKRFFHVLDYLECILSKKGYKTERKNKTAGPRYLYVFTSETLHFV